MSNENTNLRQFRVTLNEEAGDKFTLVFDCMAEDADDAAGQAEKAYPVCTVINCTEFEGNLPLDSWLRNLRPGDQVWWNDPDNGISSGYYIVTGINADSVEYEDTVILLKNSAGSEAQVFASELSPTQPEGLYPVVDGDSGEIEIYGYAKSKEEAMEVGNATFPDAVVDAYLATNVRLWDGSIIPHAWVACTSVPSQTVKVRLILDVTYSLNGENATEMVGRLQKMCEHAIGNGMLTGETDAEVDEYSMEATIQPEPLSEDEVADFMLQRIENGQLALEDIPVRLARYGLMAPNAFVDEVRERMDMAKQEA